MTVILRHRSSHSKHFYINMNRDIFDTKRYVTEHFIRDRIDICRICVEIMI